MSDPRLVDYETGRKGKNSGVAFNVADAMDWRPMLQTDLTSADSDKVFTVPAGKQWQFQSLRIELETFSSTAVAGSTQDRQIEVQFLSTANDVLFSVKAGAVHGQNLVRSYDLAPQLADLTSFRDTVSLTTPFPNFILDSGYDLHVFDKDAKNPAGDDMVVHLNVLERTTPTT